MPLTTKVKVAVLEGACAADEAETLLAWLIEKPQGQLNLKQCTHLHTAVLQVMMASGAKISIWPQDQQLCQLLQAAGWQA